MIDYVDYLLVYFFWLWLVDVVGVQVGFDMVDWNVVVECGQSGGYCGGGIVVYQYVIWVDLCVECVKLFEQFGIQVIEGLVGYYDVEVMVGGDFEQ